MSIILPPQDIELEIWNDKYRFFHPDGSTDEETIEDSNARVVRAVFAKDKSPAGLKAAKLCLDAMNKREFVPAGRQHAGAGTMRAVTMINCYVSPTIQDSMITEFADLDPKKPKDVQKALDYVQSVGIMDALKIAAFTQQMGGGIGMDFSTLRPKGAYVEGVGVPSSGPMHFMDMWDAMCQTIRSAGHRRGAMMGTLVCHHPDIFDFVTAKQKKGRLENFNVSVLVTDRFMEAVKNNEPWELGFAKSRDNGMHEFVLDYNPHTGEKGTWFVYNRIQARVLWESIIESTYDYAEPGVIFIDRINKTNNLWYCETISATNPCGEQPLPPNGACDLAAINLAALVDKPFTNEAEVNFNRLVAVSKMAVRYLDNVLDVTLYPTPEQQQESMNKRRIGLGITGLGNMLQALKIRYGDDEAVVMTEQVMEAIRNAAYRSSIIVAKEKGPFPLYDKKKFAKGYFIKTLPVGVRKRLSQYGIRNGVLLTVAPTGTTSIYYGNMSSGLEPTFAWSYARKVRQEDGTYKPFSSVQDYGYRLYKHVNGIPDDEDVDDLPDYMVSAQELSVDDHLVMQTCVQKYIDASVSKTINCPEDMTFEDFQFVYTRAYEMGCKGCTTYRPSKIAEEVRGSVLSIDDDKPQEIKLELPDAPLGRPEELQGTTYKVRWPGSNHAIYVTINDYEQSDGSKRPFEIFINTKDASHTEWVMSLTLTLSAIFRRGGDISFLPAELQAVHASETGVFLKQKYTPSRVAAIGDVLERHFQKINILPSPNVQKMKVLNTTELADVAVIVNQEEQKESDEYIINLTNDDTSSWSGEISGAVVCPNCRVKAMVHEEGCNTCKNCGHSDCG